MITIRRRLGSFGSWVFLPALLVAASVAVGQESQAPPQSEAESGGQQAEPQATTVTTTKEEPKPYDLWTTKNLTGDWGGVRTEMEDAGVNFSILLGTMTQMNFRGGLNTHNAHETAGKAFYNMELDFGKMGLVSDGTFFIRGIQTWNSGIRRHVGSLWHPYYSAGSSGDKEIELDKYWYRQRLFDDRLEFRFGKLDMADWTDRNAYADSYMSKFMNQALYVNRTIPTTKAVGAFLKVWPVDWLYVQAAALDPDIGQSKHTRGTGGWDTAFHDEDRFRAFWEFGLVPKFEGANGLLPGHYRFGWWLDPKPKTVFRDTLGGLLAERRRSGDVGFYFNFDQMVWKENDNPKDKQGLGVFARVGAAHRDVNKISHVWSLGAAYQGLFPMRESDVLGFGVAQAILSSQYRDNIDSRADRETVYELYYKIKVAPWCEITPDVQVITNPGADKDARDALVGGIRIKIAI
ncbi:MAG: carbohydrate porin [Phycisphaerae bacterium]